MAVYDRNYQTLKDLTIPFTVETGDPERKSDEWIIERIAIDSKLGNALFEGSGVSRRRMRW